MPKNKNEAVPNWRLIGLATHSAAQNMAIDQAVLESVAAGHSPPTIRFYQWQPSAVTIGYFQSLAQEVNEQECRSRGFDIVRRQTGGGAVFHDCNGEITYSVIGKEKLFERGITESYREICGSIISALARISIHSEFKPINDIVVNGKKISGNAQTRRNGVLLQHGTVLYDLDVATMFNVLKITKEKISDKLITRAKQRVTRILDHTDVSMDTWYQALQKGFCERKTIVSGTLSETEQSRARELVQTKYASNQWNYWR